MSTLAHCQQNMVDVEPADKRGHDFKVSAHLDYEKGGYAWLWQCNCGQAYLLEKKTRKEKTRFSVIETECPEKEINGSRL